MKATSRPLSQQIAHPTAFTGKAGAVGAAGSCSGMESDSDAFSSFDAREPFGRNNALAFQQHVLDR